MAERLRDVLAALEFLDRMLQLDEDLEEERGRLREYVRREHVPFLNNRLRTFEEYLTVANPRNFKHYTRVTVEEFEELHERLAPRLRHPITHASPIPPRWRIATFLRFVGHPNSFSSLAENFHMGRTTVSSIVYEVANVIRRELYGAAFPVITRDYLESVAVRTQQLCDYPRAVGFLDGKHVYMEKPPRSGSEFYNYKNRFSIILLAVVDCYRRILIYDVGAPGRAGDAGFFSRSGIKRFFDNNDDVFPPTRELGQVGPVPYHILADNGFAIGRRYITPYYRTRADTASKRRFNQKHSRARRIVEQAFGLLRGRFRILATTIKMEPDRAMDLVESLLVLHNWILRRRNAGEIEDAHNFAEFMNQAGAEEVADAEEMNDVGEVDHAADPAAQDRAERRRAQQEGEGIRDKIRCHYDNIYGVLR